MLDVNNNDVVHEPQHYKQGLYETIDEMLIIFGANDTETFCRLNAWKYRARANYKGNKEQDLKKADEYLKLAYQIQNLGSERKIELLKGEKRNENI